MATLLEALRVTRAIGFLATRSSEQRRADCGLRVEGWKIRNSKFEI
jgi:hypothetical protein